MRNIPTTILIITTLASPVAAQTGTAFVNGRWFNGTSFETRTMYASQGLLRTSKPASVDTTIDLQGGYVVPPFGEAHNHNIEGSSRIAAVLSSYINDGIFYVLNPNSLPRSKTSLAGQINKPDGIDVIFSNGGLNVTRGHPWDLVERNIARGTWQRADAEGAFFHTIDNRADLDRKWPAIVAAKPDFIKIYLLFSNEHQQRMNDTTGFRGLDPALVPDIVKRAHDAKLRVAAHIENVHDFRAAVSAGVDIIAHMPGYGWLGAGDSTQFALTRADAELAARRATAVVTTLGFGRRANAANRTPAQVRRDALNARNLKLLKDAGVRIAIGSDNYRAHSRSEALYLSDLGVFSNLELLKMWSEVTPRVIFPHRKIGSLRDGNEASFLVLADNPIVDFNNTERINLRVKQGRPIGTHTPQSSTSEDAGLTVLRQVHARYSKTRFRSVSFLQKTTFPDGRVEWWYEAESIPGKARVDIAPLANRNASIFRSDSAYIFRDGALTRTGSGLNATMWTLMDMYAVPPEETAAALRRRNFDLAKVHERDWNGRPIIVIGALAGDTLSAQFWLDKEHLYTVRQIVPVNGHRVTEVSKHVFMSGGWIEQEIRVYLNGQMTLLEEYTNTKVNVELPANFFDPDMYRAPHWTEIHPRE